MDDHDLVPRGDAAVIVLDEYLECHYSQRWRTKYGHAAMSVLRRSTNTSRMAGMGYLTATERYDVRFGPISVLWMHESSTLTVYRIQSMQSIQR